jgi:hypothetical protein
LAMSMSFRAMLDVKPNSRFTRASNSTRHRVVTDQQQSARLEDTLGAFPPSDPDPFDPLGNGNALAHSPDRNCLCGGGIRPVRFPRLVPKGGIAGNGRNTRVSGRDSVYGGKMSRATFAGSQPLSEKPDKLLANMTFSL